VHHPRATDAHLCSQFCGLHPLRVVIWRLRVRFRRLRQCAQPCLFPAVSSELLDLRARQARALRSGMEEAATNELRDGARALASEAEQAAGFLLGHPLAIPIWHARHRTPRIVVPRVDAHFWSAWAGGRPWPIGQDEGVTVDAIFEFPVPIWVMTDALDTTYAAGYGNLKFNVVMPTANGPNGGPPAVPGLEGRPELSSPDVTWVHEYGAFIPESYKPATALHRVAITDADGPTPAHLTWFTPDAQLVEYVTPWFNAVRTWAEVVTGQDLDPNHRVYDAVAVGHGLTFLEQTHDGAHGLQITTPRVLPVPAKEWEAILKLVSDGKEPPLEELLSRDARASQRRGAERRSILEAATAVEIVLSRHVRGLADQLPEAQQRRLTDRTALGGYIDIAETSGIQLAVPYEQLRQLSALRNDAAHRGEAPNNWDTGTAVQTAMDFLSAHGPYARSTEREPDGSEFVLVDPKDD
jgi:hypothetical protein